MKFIHVRAELKAIIERELEKGDTGATRVAQLALGNHADINGADKEFAICCSFRALRNEARGLLNSVKFSDSGQNVFSGIGFDHLQRSYSVVRGNKKIHIRVEDCSPQELLDHADQLDSMGRACQEHADEIRRFVTLRLQGIGPHQSPEEFRLIS